MKVKERDKVVTEIRNAPTEEKVLSIVRHYVSSLAAHELAVIPLSLAGKAIGNAQDVAQISMVLAKQDVVEGSKSEAGVLKDAALIFATASAQMSKLAGSKATK
jgi:hypothetical protein